MEIADESVPEQVERFREKMADRAAEHGKLAGIACGEQFKRLAEL
jgi:hypothetical protein